MVHCETCFFSASLRAEVMLVCQGIWLCRACTLFGSVLTGSCGLGHQIRETAHHYAKALSMETEHRAYDKSGKQDECCALIHQHLKSSRTSHSLVGGIILPC